MKALRFLAGEQAAAHIRKEGLRESDIKVMVGAAGGPKWLGLRHLDRAILSHWFVGRKEPLYLIGSSIGAWRFACYAQKEPLAAFERFLDAYLSYSWSPDHSPARITSDTFRVLQALMGRKGVGDILAHPFMRLNIMTVRSKRPVDSEHPLALKLGMTAAAVSNAVHRPSLGLLFERALFEDSRNEASFCRLDELPHQRIALSEDNLEMALLASSSIPTILEGVRDIAGAPPGTYRDGGITDYHLNLPYLEDLNGLVFYPHFTDRIIPGWFDKFLPWRKADEANLSRMLVVCPSPEMLDRLPHKKIPDRKDFVNMPDEDRLAYWRIVLSETEHMADDFHDVIEGDRIAERLEPLRP